MSLKQFTNLLVGRIDPDFLIMVIQTIAEAQNVAAYWLDVLGKN